MNELQEYILNITGASASVAAMDVTNAEFAEEYKKMTDNNGFLTPKMMGWIKSAFNEAVIRVDRISEEDARVLLSTDKRTLKDIKKMNRKIKKMKGKIPTNPNRFKDHLKFIVSRVIPAMFFDIMTKRVTKEEK